MKTLKRNDFNVIRISILFSLFFASASSSGQKPTLINDLNNDKIEDSVFLNEDNTALNILLSIKDKQYSRIVFNLPEITGFENKNIINYKPQFLDIEYSSSHVSTISLILCLNNGKLFIKGMTLFAPCQTCENTQIRTCEVDINKNISDISDKDIENFIDNDKKSCRINHENIAFDLNKGFGYIFNYYTQIKYLEKSTSQTRLDKYIKKYPILPYISKYLKIALCLSRAGKYKESIYLLEQIIKNDPQYLEAYLKLADINWEVNNILESKKYYNSYIKIYKQKKRDLSSLPSRVVKRSR